MGANAPMQYAISVTINNLKNDELRTTSAPCTNSLPKLLKDNSHQQHAALNWDLSEITQWYLLISKSTLMQFCYLAADWLVHFQSQLSHALFIARPHNIYIFDHLKMIFTKSFFLFSTIDHAFKSMMRNVNIKSITALSNNAPQDRTFPSSKFSAMNLCGNRSATVLFSRNFGNSCHSVS